MRDFLISKSDDVIVFPAGFIDEVVSTILSPTTKLVVFSGYPGVGKTEAIKAIMKKIKDEGTPTSQDVKTLSSLNIAGSDYQTAITNAAESAVTLPDTKESEGLSLVVWDEVRGADYEFEAIDQLIGKGYTVIVAIQESGVFCKHDKHNFVGFAEYQGGVAA